MKAFKKPGGCYQPFEKEILRLVILPRLMAVYDKHLREGTLDQIDSPSKFHDKVCADVGEKIPAGVFASWLDSLEIRFVRTFRIVWPATEPPPPARAPSEPLDESSIRFRNEDFPEVPMTRGGLNGDMFGALSGGPRG